MKNKIMYLGFAGIIGLLPFEGNYIFFLFFLTFLFSNSKVVLKKEKLMKCFLVAGTSNIVIVSIGQIIAYIKDIETDYMYQLGFDLFVIVLVISLLLMTFVKNEKVDN